MVKARVLARYRLSLRKSWAPPPIFDGSKLESKYAKCTYGSCGGKTMGYCVRTVLGQKSLFLLSFFSTTLPLRSTPPPFMRPNLIDTLPTPDGDAIMKNKRRTIKSSKYEVEARNICPRKRCVRVRGTGSKKRRRTTRRSDGRRVKRESVFSLLISHDTKCRREQRVPVPPLQSPW